MIKKYSDEKNTFIIGIDGIENYSEKHKIDLIIFSPQSYIHVHFYDFFLIRQTLQVYFYKVFRAKCCIKTTRKYSYETCYPSFE